MINQQQASFRKGYVSGDFLTANYRITGEVPLRGIPVLDQLNDHMAFFIEVEHTFISPLHNPAALTGNFRYSNLRIENIGLLVLKQIRDGLPRREGQYMGHTHVDRELLFVAAGFELRGVLRLHPSVDLTHFVRTTPERFIPLFNASARLLSAPEIAFKGGAVLLNRGQIEIFNVLEE